MYEYYMLKIKKHCAQYWDQEKNKDTYGQKAEGHLDGQDVCF